MQEIITLAAADGHKLSAYCSFPSQKAKGAIVVVQEIFGVNAHIRSIADRFAALGYAAIAPAIFDRILPGFESGYSQPEVERARSYYGKVPMDEMLLDTRAALEAVGQHGRIGVVGFCLGGSIAFHAALKLSGVAAAVGYYGGMIAEHAQQKPKAPVQLHFGEKDPTIPMSDVEKIKRERQDVEVYIYDAGHAFNRDGTPNYDEKSAALAWSRTTAFMAKYLAD
jgi:carboxymethylenebutenolidase